MIRSIFKVFLSVTVIPSFLLYTATYGTAKCDLEQTPISLKAYNKTVTEILKDIESQANYTIKVPSPELLGNKVSIEFDKTPLNRTLKRLLKGVNHSIICDNELNTLTLILLDKNTLSSSIPTGSTTKNSLVDSMVEVSAAFDDYFNSKGETSLYSQEEPEEMKGLSSAMQEFHQNKLNNTTPTMPHSQKTSMDEVTEAFNQYKVNHNEEAFLSSQEEPEEMKGLSSAIQEFHQNKLNNTIPTMPHSQKTSMDEVTEAFKQYKANQ